MSWPNPHQVNHIKYEGAPHQSNAAHPQHTVYLWSTAAAESLIKIYHSANLTVPAVDFRELR